MSPIDRRRLLQGTAGLAVTATLAGQAISRPAAGARQPVGRRAGSVHRNRWTAVPSRRTTTPAPANCRGR